MKYLLLLMLIPVFTFAQKTKGPLTLTKKGAPILTHEFRSQSEFTADSIQNLDASVRSGFAITYISSVDSSFFMAGYIIIDTTRQELSSRMNYYKFSKNVTWFNYLEPGDLQYVEVHTKKAKFVGDITKVVLHYRSGKKYTFFKR